MQVRLVLMMVASKVRDEALAATCHSPRMIITATLLFANDHLPATPAFSDPLSYQHAWCTDSERQARGPVVR